MQSCVLIIPVALHAKANALGVAMGWGPGNFSVALSATGAEPATYFGLHSWVEPRFVLILQSASAGIMPQSLIDAGYPEADFDAVTGSLMASIRPDNTGHFDEICDAEGLAKIVPPDKP